MRYFLLIILLSVFITTKADDPLKIGVITDIHYLSDKLMTDGQAMSNYIQASGKNIKYTPYVLNDVLEEYASSDINTLLITGDLTKDGEKQSHLELSEKFRLLRDKGINVFVIPGNHDINISKAVGFNHDNTYSVPSITPDEFIDIYKDCGFSGAIDRDTASLSYVARLNADTWLLAIDAAKYKEKTTSSGRISETTQDWIIKVLDEAKTQNIQVMAMMHWGITEHIMYQSEFFGNYLVDDWQQIAPLLADNGVRVIFTGHFHANDITMYKSPEGNKIYDVETGALASFPYSYRFVELYKDRINITTKNITSVSQNPSLAEDSKQTLRQFALNQAKSRLRKLGIEISDEMSKVIGEIIADIFVLHLFGDEQPDNDTLNLWQGLTEIMDMPADTDDIQLDFYPADNNVLINF